MCSALDCADEYKHSSFEDMNMLDCWKCRCCYTESWGATGLLNVLLESSGG
jgi:hypothetical protein